MPVHGRPLFKDFMGINGHFTFKPALYSQVCRLVRNYHNVDWDVKQPGDPVTIPVTANKINWKTDVYGPWKAAGIETDICIQFATFGGGHEKLWNGKEQWAYDYTKAMAAYFGPSGKEQLATSFEIDNEPGVRFDTVVFRKLFKQMAQGIRDGDPRAKILTPTVHARKADSYSQSLYGMYADKDILPLYDVINVHTYSTLEKSATSENTWNRSYPEDSTLQYLKVIDEAIAWRNSNASDKEVWVTEFGYDACTPEAMKTRKDWMLKLNWQGASDSMQAQYLVRSFLVFAARDVKRAYLYYYNDDDEAGFHAASGLTRHFNPKMSFWAVRQLYQTLGDYRFRRVVKRNAGELYIFEFEQVRERSCFPLHRINQCSGRRLWITDTYIPEFGIIGNRISTALCTLGIGFFICIIVGSDTAQERKIMFSKFMFVSKEIILLYFGIDILILAYTGSIH
jgi:hypothetical protein